MFLHLIVDVLYFNSQPHKEADCNFIQQKLLLTFHFYNNLPISPTFSPPLPSFRTLFSHFQQKFQVRISRGLGGSLGFAL